MPWKEAVAMHLREEFVIRAKAPHANVAALSREYGISRKTAYKWLARFEEGGLAALADLDRRPHRSPLRASADVALAVVRVRTAHATWGPRKIVVVLAREGGLKRVPSVRTVSRILDFMSSPKHQPNPRAWPRRLESARFSAIDRFGAVPLKGF